MAGTGIRATLLVALSEQRNSPEAMCFQPDAADADVAATFPDSPPPPPPPLPPHEQQQHLEPSPSPSSPEGSTPSSQPSPSAPSNRRKVMAMSASVSLRALQHLPIPLLVLDARKTIVLANDALGEYLGFSAREGDRGSGGGGDGGGDARYIEVTEQLLGMPLKQLGIDAFAKDATLCLLSWEAQLDLLTREVGPDGKFKTERIDVHVPLRGAQVSWGQGPPGPARRTQLTISPWKDEGRVFFTCTFKTLPSKRLSRPSEGERDEWPAKNYTLVSEVSESKSDRTETSDERTAATLMEKIEVLEEALIDAMETPVIAMYNDSSVALPNRACCELIQPPDSTTDSGEEPRPFDRMLTWNNLKVYTPDFSRQLRANELPLLQMIATRKPVGPVTVGILPGGQRKLVDVTGKCIWNKAGEFVGALAVLQDVTKMAEMQRKLDTEAHRNELRSKDILDCIPQMIWTSTPDGRYDYFSKRWYDYTGLKPEQCLGTPDSQGLVGGYHVDDIETIEARWQHSLTTGENYVVEYRCRRHDGEFRWMLGRALPLRDPKTGEIVKWYGTTTDIHDMVQARTAERTTRRQLSEALNHAKLSLWAVNSNRTLYLLEGCNEQKLSHLVGKDIKDAFAEVDPGDKYGALDGATRVLLGEINEWFGDCEFNGQWFSNKFVPVRGLRGPCGEFDPNHVTDVICLSMDVTAIYHTERELQERERQNRVLQANEAAAREASKLKSEFLASMSHEIRTPIAGVVGMCEILLDEWLTPEQRELGEGIQRSANALLTIINDILDLSKVESGKMDVEEVPFNLSVVITDVVKMLAFEADRKKLQFEHEINFPGTGDLTVMGDPGRVRQILANLLSNAVKFTHEGIVELKASIGDEDEDTLEVNFAIRDTGIGIADSDQCKLFQPFTQADSSTARRFGGTGLGLTICKNLVTLMGGDIGLDSSAGEGTSARFTIPFKRASSERLMEFDIDEIPERLQSDMSVSCRSSSNTGTRTPPDSVCESCPAEGETYRPTNSTNSGSLSQHLNWSFLQGVEEKRHVLVVEDNEVNQQIAIRLVKKLNFTVSAVRNGLECLEFMKRCATLPTTDDATSALPPSPRRPDVILMDVQMPEMDGYSATRAIRSGLLHPFSAPGSTSTLPCETPGVAEWLSRVPIVAMTASAIKGDREKCKEAGMDDYLAKPVRGGMLEKMLIKWCSGNGGAEFRRRGSQVETQARAIDDVPVRSAPFPMTASDGDRQRAKRVVDGRRKGKSLQP